MGWRERSRWTGGVSEWLGGRHRPPSWRLRRRSGADFDPISALASLAIYRIWFQGVRSLLAPATLGYIGFRGSNSPGRR